MRQLEWDSNGYGDESSIYSTTTEKVKTIIKKCKKGMKGWKLKNQGNEELRENEKTFKNQELKQTCACDTNKLIGFLCLAVVVGEWSFVLRWGL